MKTIKIMITGAALCFFAMPISAMELRTRNGMQRNPRYLHKVSGQLNAIATDLEDLIDSLEEETLDLRVLDTAVFEEIKQTLNEIEATNKQHGLGLDDQIINAYAMLYVVSSIADENREDQNITVLQPTSFTSSQEDFGTLTEEEALRAFGPFKAPAEETRPLLSEQDQQEDIPQSKTPELSYDEKPTLESQPLASINDANEETAPLLPKKLHRTMAYVAPELLPSNHAPSTSVWARVKEVARYLCCCRKQKRED